MNRFRFLVHYLALCAIFALAIVLASWALIAILRRFAPHDDGLMPRLDRPALRLTVPTHEVCDLEPMAGDIGTPGAVAEEYERAGGAGK